MYKLIFIEVICVCGSVEYSTYKPSRYLWFDFSIMLKIIFNNLKLK